MMAGYRVRRKVYVLEFDDPEFEGAVVKAHGFTLEEGLNIEGVLSGKDGGDRLREMLKMFAERITEWNLEGEAGEPLPVTYESLMDQDPTFTLPMFRAWRNAVMEVPAPLDQESSSGDTSVLGSMPMEPIGTASLPS